MTVSVYGIGWLSPRGFGCVRTGTRKDLPTEADVQAALKEGVFTHPFKNFGRLDVLARTTAYAVALALSDAGIGYAPGSKQDIGIVGTGTEGSLAADLAYFRDYVRGGRTLSRGNLFIYTLPSSALGEAAIHFGLLGPLLYLSDETSSLPAVLDAASQMIACGEAKIMLAGKAEGNEALFLVLGRDGNQQPVLCTVEDARSIAAENPDLALMTRKFAALPAGQMTV